MPVVSGSCRNCQNGGNQLTDVILVITVGSVHLLIAAGNAFSYCIAAEQLLPGQAVGSVTACSIAVQITPARLLLQLSWAESSVGSAL
jgi:hypothetical protein